MSIYAIPFTATQYGFRRVAPRADCRKGLGRSFHPAAWRNSRGARHPGRAFCIPRDQQPPPALQRQSSTEDTASLLAVTAGIRERQEQVCGGRKVHRARLQPWP